MLGVVIVYTGLAVLAVGVGSLFRPVAVLRIRTRRRGALAEGAGVALVALGMRLPARIHHDKHPGRRVCVSPPQSSAGGSSGNLARPRLPGTGYRGREPLERLNLPYSLVMLDLDRFKDFNEAHGHLAGDDLLRGVGKVIRRAMRTTRAVASGPQASTIPSSALRRPTRCFHAR